MIKCDQGPALGDFFPRDHVLLKPRQSTLSSTDVSKEEDAYALKESPPGQASLGLSRRMWFEAFELKIPQLSPIGYQMTTGTRDSHESISTTGWGRDRGIFLGAFGSCPTLCFRMSGW